LLLLYDAVFAWWSAQMIYLSGG